MQKSGFKLTYKDDKLNDLIAECDHKTLSQWAYNCVEHVLYLYDDKYKYDDRPYKALKGLKNWIETGIFKMKDIRKYSLDSHATAREIGEDNPSRSFARAAGQAVASAHARMHSLAAANYALQGIYRASDPKDPYIAINEERKWQYDKLKSLIK